MRSSTATIALAVLAARAVAAPVEIYFMVRSQPMELDMALHKELVVSLAEAGVDVQRYVALQHEQGRFGDEFWVMTTCSDDNAAAWGTGRWTDWTDGGC